MNGNRRYRFLLLLSLGLISSESVLQANPCQASGEEARRQCEALIIPLKKETSCLRLATSALQAYKEFAKSWLANASAEPLAMQAGASAGHVNPEIRKNLNLILQTNLDETRSFVGRLRALPEISAQSSPEALENAKQALSVLEQEFLAAQARAAADAMHFKTLMGQFDYALQISFAFVEKVLQDLETRQCHTFSSFGTIEQIYAELYSWLGYKTWLNREVDQIQRKRYLLVRSLIHMQRREVVAVMISKAQGDVSALQRAIRAEFLADALLTEINRWWNQENLSGTARGLLAKYLQFHEPRRLLRSYLARLDDFEARLQGIGDLAAADRQLIQGEIEKYRQISKEALDQLEARGWQGVMERQKILHQARLQKIDRYPSGCEAAIKGYLAAAENINDPHAFQSVELLYKNSIATCEGAS